VPTRVASADDTVVLAVEIDGEIQTLRLPMDFGVTEEKQRLMADLYKHTTRAASRVIAYEEGLRFEWDDGRLWEFRPYGWKAAWAGHPPVDGVKALKAYIQFEGYQFAVVGQQMDHEIAEGRRTLQQVLADFPQVVEYSPPIQVRLRDALESGKIFHLPRGNRSPSFRRMMVERWLTMVSRVEEFHRLGFSYEEAFGKVAEAEGRTGADPAAAIRGQYKRGRQWQKWFGRS